jgi:hypothetical protein
MVKRKGAQARGSAATPDDLELLEYSCGLKHPLKRPSYHVIYLAKNLIDFAYLALVLQEDWRVKVGNLQQGQQGGWEWVTRRGGQMISSARRWCRRRRAVPSTYHGV